MTRLVPVVALSLALIIGGGMITLALAQPGGTVKIDGSDKDMRRGKMAEKLAVILDLTAEQQEAFAVLQEKHRGEMQPVREKMRTLMQKLDSQMAASPVDEAALRATSREKADLETEMLLMRNRHQGQMKALLTPEQQAKAEKLRALEGAGGRGMGMSHRHSGMGGGMGGPPPME